MDHDKAAPSTNPQARCSYDFALEACISIVNKYPRAWSWLHTHYRLTLPRLVAIFMYSPGRRWRGFKKALKHVHFIVSMPGGMNEAHTRYLHKSLQRFKEDQYPEWNDTITPGWNHDLAKRYRKSKEITD